MGLGCSQLAANLFADEGNRRQNFVVEIVESAVVANHEVALDLVGLGLELH